METLGSREELMDLAIIGGGPAGTSAALEARRRGLKVALWERDRFPSHKVCGEFLSAECLPLLEQEIPRVLERGRRIHRARFVFHGGRAYSFALPSPCRGLSRRRLDAALWDAAASAGAVTRHGDAVRTLRKLSVQTEGGTAWELESQSGTTGRARAVIVACGRWWSLEGFPSPARQAKTKGIGPWLGAKAHFQGVAPRDEVEMYFFPGGYCGLAPIEDGVYNACCLVHRCAVRDSVRNSLMDFGAWLQGVVRHPALEARLRGTTQVGKTVVSAPLRPARRSAEFEGALIVGDASGFLDPFTGEGISIAVHSGRLAVEELARRWFSQGGAAKPTGGYRQRLEHSVERTYRVAALVRALASAPRPVQAWVGIALPWLGTRLFAQTRWRPAKG